MKASFAQFLSLRHGGSGFVFGYGGGATGQKYAVLHAANPTHRPRCIQPDPVQPAVPLAVVPGHQLHDHAPAALPPSAYTDPPTRATPPTTHVAAKRTRANYIGDPASGTRRSTRASPRTRPPTPVGALRGEAPRPKSALVPPAIPVRRLFQPPDANSPTPTPAGLTRATRARRGSLHQRDRTRSPADPDRPPARCLPSWSRDPATP